MLVKRGDHFCVAGYGLSGGSVSTGNLFMPPPVPPIKNKGCNISDTIKLEFGGKEFLYAYYLSLKIFCYDRTGFSTIHVEVDNHLYTPERNKAEFYITTIPARLHKLGASFKNWNSKASKHFEWLAD